MPDITITLTKEEIDALEKVVPDAQEWIHNAVIGKLHSCLSRLILEHTDRNPKKLTHQEKLALITPLNIESRKERDAKEMIKAGGLQNDAVR